ncbi:MAG: SEC-C metal-binding domain-containing protein [Candidatus Paceibacterota bacterium]|jgi:hypothetical protein
MDIQLSRNSKCSCGSGKKYKKCCLEKDQQNRPASVPGGAIAGVLYGPISTASEDHFLNRFMFGILNIRDFVVPKEKRNEFDKDYDAILQNLTEANFAKDFSLSCMKGHIKAIHDGKDGVVTGYQLNVTHPIDTELNVFFKDFFIRSTMAIGGLQRLLNKWFGYNTSFLFSDDEKKFKKGASSFKLDQKDPRFQNLAMFIKSHRDDWYIKFKDLRDDIEHNGYKLPQIKHRVGPDGKVQVLFPAPHGQTIEQILNIGWNNLLNLCEEVLVFIMSLELKDQYIIWKVPEEKREQFNWVRYKVSIPDFPEAHVSCS